MEGYGPRTEQESCRLSIPGSVSFLPAVQAFVGTVASEAGFAKQDRERIELAMEEAISDISGQSGGGSRAAGYDLYCRKRFDGLEIVVKSKKMAASRTPQYESQGLDSAERTQQGLGKFLTRQLMDLVEYEDGYDGCSIRMVKYYPTTEETPHSEPAAETAASSGLAEIRRIKAAEASRVISLIRRFGTKINIRDCFLQTTWLAGANERSEAISAVALSANGDLIGHLALFPCMKYHKIMEIGAWAAAPDHSRDLLAKLTEYLLEEAFMRGIEGIIAHVEVGTEYFRMLCQEFDFKACGCTITYDAGGKPYLLARVFRSMQVSLPVTVSLPKRHKGLLESIFGELGVVLEPWEPAGLLEQDTILSIGMDAQESFGRIIVTSSGTDIENRLNKQIAWLEAEKMDSIELLVDLAGAGISSLLGYAEKRGFCLTGIMPGLSEENYLTMRQLSPEEKALSQTISSDDSGRLLGDLLSGWA